MAKRVLVVDDHVPTRALIRTILEAEKTEQFEVFEAGTGHRVPEGRRQAGARSTSSCST